MRGRTQRARARRRRGRRHRDPRRPPRGRQRGADHGRDRPLAERRDPRGHAAGHRARSPGHRRSAPREVARTDRPRDALSRRRRLGGCRARRDPPRLAAGSARIARCAPAGPPSRHRAPRRREWRAKSSSGGGFEGGRAPFDRVNLAIAPEVSAALAAGGAVVALESTVIAHGLPRPRNLETAQALEADIHALGAIPATIALSDGHAVVGAGDVLLERLAKQEGGCETTLPAIVPVLGYGTDDLPAFYVRSSGLRLSHRVNDALGAARIAREQFARGSGMVLAVPIPVEMALDHDEVETDVMRSIGMAEREGIRGAELTPYLLRSLGESTRGRALDANIALLRANARVAAQLALALCT